MANDEWAVQRLVPGRGDGGGGGGSDGDNGSGGGGVDDDGVFRLECLMGACALDCIA